MTVNKDKADLVLSSILTIPLLKMSVGTTAIMDVVNIRPKGWKAYVQGLYLFMPCPYTGPKMFCADPNFLCQI